MVDHFSFGLFMLEHFSSRHGRDQLFDIGIIPTRKLRFSDRIEKFSI